MLDRRLTFGGDVIPAWIATPPKYIRPQRKMTVTPIAGSNREVVEMEDAYEEYDQPYTLFVFGETEDSLEPLLDAVAEKLYKTGWQVLTDDYSSDTFRLAYFKGSYDIENRHTRAGKFDITFHCRPERFLIAGNTAVNVASGEAVFNPTANNAKPLIHIAGSGSGTLTVNGTTMSFANMLDYLNIDCDPMDCYRLPSENRNSLMTGEFPVLKTGNNLVSFTGGITSVTITPRYWKL